MAKKQLFFDYEVDGIARNNPRREVFFKGITMPTTLKYSELRHILYNVTEVSSLDFNIITRVKYKLYCACPTASINDNADVKCLIS